MKPAIIVHGGAGRWPEHVDDAKCDVLRHAAQVGWDIMHRGGSALDAVEKSVNILEDDPLFNAGMGSTPTIDGTIELDALCIDAASYNFGAVAGVKRVANAISLARLVMEKTDHNFIIGTGAEELAIRYGTPLIPNLALMTDSSIEFFRQRARAKAGDTVGAVAIDAAGNIAVGTSTGGTGGKLPGRVGDVPVFGAGGYADKDYGGASATGHGEYSLRTLITRYAVDRITAGSDAQSAAEEAMIHIDRFFDPSLTGIIVVDKQGNIGAAHTTEKLGIGWIDAQGKPQANVRGGLAHITQ